LQQPSDAIVIAAVVGSGGAGAAIDLWMRRVPNPLTIGIAALGIALAATRVNNIGVLSALAGFAVGLALMLPGHFIGATGAGDVKLLAALGTLLGPSRIGWAFLYTAIAGGVIAVVIAIRRRRLDETLERAATLVYTGGGNVAEIEAASNDNRFAYAPAIAIGSIVAALS
jgi:prepilin peptidase CpaA